MWEPLGNTTDLPPAQWHTEPQFRGTFSILSSCLITMSLCIWTSLHLNLPEHEKEHLQKYRKLGWMTLGLFAPELVVWNAWEQRKKAKRLSALMEKEGFKPKEATKWQTIISLFNKEHLQAAESNVRHNGRVHAWTDVHSWFVVMGGMAFSDTSPEDQQFMPEGRSRQIPTLKGFEVLVKRWPHLIPDISREYIQDKSKSDWLAKGLTCWQTAYFCTQCIFRLSQHLSITLLELNVFAHAICALLLFLIWWDKPRDVSQPTLILGQEALDVCAYLSGPDLLTPDGRRRFHLKALLNSQPLDQCYYVTTPTTFVPSIPVTHKNLLSSQRRVNALLGPQKQQILRVRDTYWRLEVESWESNAVTVALTGRDIERLVRAYRANISATSFGGLNAIPNASWGLGFGTQDRCSLWTLRWDDLFFFATEGLFKPRFARITAGVTFAGGCYGGLHLIAWASAFPSQTEMLLWRAASVTILVTGPFCASIAVLMTGLVLVSVDVTVYFTFGILALLIPWYILCRAFIVVECFILLAHIPETALGVSTWANYIPSFS